MAPRPFLLRISFVAAQSYEISQTEFRKALHAHGFDAPKQLTQVLFDEIDSDGTYKIDYKEMQAWLDDEGEE